MSTISERLLDRVRMELGDLPQPFDYQFVGDGVRDHFNVEHRPFNEASISVLSYGDPVDPTTEGITLDGLTGTVVFQTAPDVGSPWEIHGQKWRYFSDADLQVFLDTSLANHAHHRADAGGGMYTTADIPPVEEYPIALYAAIQALWALATDASFDIDILAPDGVNIPRSERYRQLMEMIGARQHQYDELAAALNIGVARMETLTIRRIAKLTNRFVPVFMPQEYDDFTPPQRIYPPTSTHGVDPVPIDKGRYNIYLYSDEPYAMVMNFQSTTGPVTPENDSYDMTGWEFYAPIVRVKGSAGPPIVQFTVEVVDHTLGIVRLSLDSAQVKKIPSWCFWELRTKVPDKEWLTKMTGDVRRQYGVVRRTP
jgi:hypothetical protein